MIIVYVDKKKTSFWQRPIQERLSKHPREKIDRKTIETDIADLKMTLNLQLKLAVYK
jgi:hypothetical protein